MASLKMLPCSTQAFWGVCAKVLLAGAGLVQAFTGRPALKAIRLHVAWAVVAFFGMFAGWGIKVAAGVAAGQYPLR